MKWYELKPTQDLYLNQDTIKKTIEKLSLKPTQDLYLNWVIGEVSPLDYILKPTQDLYLNNNAVAISVIPATLNRHKICI